MPFAQDRAMLLAQFNTKLKAISPEERIKIMTDLCSKAAEDAQTLLSKKLLARAARRTSSSSHHRGEYARNVHAYGESAIISTRKHEYACAAQYARLCKGAFANYPPECI